MTDATVPPQNLEAEESVLGAMLISPAAIDNVSDILDGSDFYRESHATIYKTILALAAKGEPADTLTVAAALPEQKTAIYQLAKVVPASANAGHYAKLVREAATLRGLVRGGGEIARLGWNGGTDSAALVEQAETIIYKLSQQRAHADTIDLPQAVKDAYDELVELDGKPRDLLGLPSGLADLDRVTRGFRKGSLIVIAADTGRGKSALWLNIVLHLVSRGVPTAARSLEMSEAELVQRALALEASIPHDRLTRGEIRADEWGRLAQACEALVGYPLALWTDALVRPAGIRSSLRRWNARNPDGLAVVDYLQLLVPDEKTDNRTADVSAISRALKVTAMDLQIPIIAVSQLRRRLPNTRPHRNDLRESGSIENDADVVILIHHQDDQPGIAELIVAKNRHGAEGSVRVKWVGDQMRFGNLVHEAVAA